MLYKDENVGAIDVVIDPTNPKVVYAGLWATRRPPWFVYAPTNGPGGGIYKSTDGGDTWKELTNGLPTQGMGKSGIAVCPSEPNRVYAVVDNLEPPPGAKGPTEAAPFGQGASGQGGFFRSDDGGEHWTKLSDDSGLWGRGWYFEHVVVDPEDADRVYVSNVVVARSEDGGHTWEVIRGSPGGDDYHQAWINPDEPATMIMASDQGCIITQNARAAAADVTWSSWLNQPIAQIYHLSVDYRFPYWVTGAQQDSGAVAVRSRGKFAEISMRDWEPIGAGGESGMHGGRPAAPGHHLRRHGLALRHGAEPVGAGHHAARGPRGGAPELDAAAGVVAGRPPGALLRQPVRLQVHGRGTELDAHQRRPDATRPGHPLQPGRHGRRTRRTATASAAWSTRWRPRPCWCPWSGSAPTTG